MNEVDRNRKWGIKDHEEIVFTPVNEDLELELEKDFIGKGIKSLLQFVFCVAVISSLVFSI